MAVRELRQLRYKVSLASRTVSDYKKLLVNDRSKPIRRFYEQNGDAFEYWRTQNYPKIKDRTKNKVQRSFGQMKQASF